MWLLWPYGTFRFQSRSSLSCQCVAPTTKRLKVTSTAPVYHLAEGDWCWCTVGEHWYLLSLEEGQRRCSLATDNRHGNTPLRTRHWRKRTVINLRSCDCRTVDNTCDGRRGAVKEQKVRWRSGFGTRFQWTEKYPYFEDIRISLQHNVWRAERSRKRARSIQLFRQKSACDGQTSSIYRARRSIAYASRSKNASPLVCYYFDLHETILMIASVTSHPIFLLCVYTTLQSY